MVSEKQLEKIEARARKQIPDKMKVGIHWSVDQETGEILFDMDEMQAEFDTMTQDLVQKYGGC